MELFNLFYSRRSGIGTDETKFEQGAASVGNQSMLSQSPRYGEKVILLTFSRIFYHIYLVQKCAALTKNAGEYLNGNGEDVILTITGKDAFANSAIGKWRNCE